MSNEAPKGRSAEDTSALNKDPQQNHDPLGDYLEPEVDAEALLEGLKSGQLTPGQQEALAGMLVEDEPHQHVMAVQQQTTMYSGSLPHPDQFNAYDEHTRDTILQMVVEDQKHTHDMQKTGLNGAIEKDKRGQRYGLTIALGGFVTAALIAPFSPAVAGLIGALDLFGMVALFVAPRVLEGRAAKQRARNQESAEPRQPAESE